MILAPEVEASPDLLAGRRLKIASGLPPQFGLGSSDTLLVAIVSVQFRVTGEEVPMVFVTALGLQQRNQDWMGFRRGA